MENTKYIWRILERKPPEIIVYKEAKSDNFEVIYTDNDEFFPIGFQNHRKYILPVAFTFYLENEDKKRMIHLKFSGELWQQK